MVTADFLSQSVYDTKEKEFERRWEKWSERQDSNLRLPVPKTGALPNCATLQPARMV